MAMVGQNLDHATIGKPPAIAFGEHALEFGSKHGKLFDAALDIGQVRALEEGTAGAEVARMFRVHRATLHRALNAILPEAGSAARAAVPGRLRGPDLPPRLQNRQQTEPR
jgi:hypothetical protein